MTMKTNNLWCVQTSGGKRFEPFLASDLDDVRKKAIELGGRNYRYVFHVGPDHRWYVTLMTRLGYPVDGMKPPTSGILASPAVTGAVHSDLPNF